MLVLEICGTFFCLQILVGNLLILLISTKKFDFVSPFYFVLILFLLFFILFMLILVVLREIRISMSVPFSFESIQKTQLENMGRRLEMSKTLLNIPSHQKLLIKTTIRHHFLKD